MAEWRVPFTLDPTQAEQAIGGIRGDLSKLGDTSREVGQKINQIFVFDQIGATIGRTASRFEGLTATAITGAGDIAGAFAAAGPLGGAIAGLGTAVQLVADYYEEQEEAAREAYEARIDLLSVERTAAREAAAAADEATRRIRAQALAREEQIDAAEALSLLERREVEKKIAFEREQITLAQRRIEEAQRQADLISGALADDEEKLELLEKQAKSYFEQGELAAEKIKALEAELEKQDAIFAAVESERIAREEASAAEAAAREAERLILERSREVEKEWREEQRIRREAIKGGIEEERRLLALKRAEQEAADAAALQAERDRLSAAKERQDAERAAIEERFRQEEELADFDEFRLSVTEEFFGRVALGTAQQIRGIRQASKEQLAAKAKGAAVDAAIAGATAAFLAATGQGLAAKSALVSAAQFAAVAAISGVGSALAPEEAPDAADAAQAGFVGPSSGFGGGGFSGGGRAGGGNVYNLNFQGMIYGGSAEMADGVAELLLDARRRGVPT